uniref:patatin-like phospholipase family protein n=1 Tax=Agathobacter sp. TaxID=2021311 RepID=UPI0040567041
MEKEKVGLVLEGGGVRGIYTAGVLDVFMEEGIRLDGVIGVSAGAIHGCSYLSGQKGRSLRYYKKYCNDPRFISIRSWIKTGDMVGADFCYRELPDKLDVYDHAAFNQCKVPFYVTCSNVKTGKAEYVQLTDMKEQIAYLRASASLPYVSRIVEINGKKYLDGACTDSIPVKAFQKMGYKRNVVVLTRPAEYRKKESKNGLSKLVYRKYPKFVQALSQRYFIYNRTMERIARMEKEGSVFVIRPKKALQIGRFEKDPENVQRVYDIGYADAKVQMEALQKWLCR